MVEIFIYCAIFGIFSGVTSGLIGVGGGIVIVPFLAWLFQLYGMPAETIMQTAIATSLATIVVTSIAATVAQHRRGAVMWPILFALTPGIAFGAWFGADFVDYLSSSVMEIVFGSFLLLNGLRMAVKMKPTPHRKLPGTVPLIISGGVIGFFSTLVGIGGGALTVPYMAWHNVAMKKAVAMGSACGLPIAIFGAVSLAIVGLDAANLPEHNVGYINLPAFLGISATTIFSTTLGVHFAHTLPTDTLKKVFAVILLTVGVKMLLSNLM